MQSEIDEVVTKTGKPYSITKRKQTIKSRVPNEKKACYYPLPALTSLNTILRINKPILYTYERMADLFKDPPIAAVNRQRNLNDVVVRAKFDTPVPNGCFKTCSDVICLLCKYSNNG